ncbi:MAG TPA: nicotinate-nucleotide adenylyltransferase [Chloroflexota bacterium]|nr:nicotinate-nucleotide adenylyltransferase [Chloroflexota bacterium]
MRVGVLGGTFDPIHLGHLAAAEDAAAELRLDRVLFVPNRVPPHKTGHAVTPVSDRVAMVELAIADNTIFSMSRIELERPGPSYTLDTLRDMRALMGEDTELFFLVGCDAVPQLHTWHEPEQLLSEFNLVVMERPTGAPVNWEAAEERLPGLREKVDVLNLADLEISSQDIRRRVKEGRPIRYYVVPPVERYIREHGLYIR